MYHVSRSWYLVSGSYWVIFSCKFKFELKLIRVTNFESRISNNSTSPPKCQMQNAIYALLIHCR